MRLLRYNKPVHNAGILLTNCNYLSSVSVVNGFRASIFSYEPGGSAAEAAWDAAGEGSAGSDGVKIVPTAKEEIKQKHLARGDETRSVPGRTY